MMWEVFTAYIVYLFVLCSAYLHMRVAQLKRNKHLQTWSWIRSESLLPLMMLLELMDFWLFGDDHRAKVPFIERKQT